MNIQKTSLCCSKDTSDMFASLNNKLARHSDSNVLKTGYHIGVVKDALYF